MAKTNKLVAPFLKWVGGKRQIMSSIVELMPRNYRDLNYIEPFIGGGAVLFHLQPRRAAINDFNEELMNTYRVIRDHPKELIESLKKHENTPDYFYKIRGLDRTAEYSTLNRIERASRIIYLNKTCYNGLYRVNNAGEFNSPFGRYKNPNIVNEPTIKAVSKYLNTHEVIISSGDYTDSFEMANENSFFYLDPPYHPISESSNFTGYVQGGWNMHDQIRLREFCDQLTARGAKFLLSNSSSEFIIDQYSNYEIHTVKAMRSINANGKNRGVVDEVLVRNYEQI